MSKKEERWVKVWIGFGFVTILSGIYLLLQKDYLIGASGTCVGIWLIAMNLRNIKKK